MITVLEEREVLLNCHLTEGTSSVSPTHHEKILCSICQDGQFLILHSYSACSLPLFLWLFGLHFPFLLSSLLPLILGAHQQPGFSSFLRYKASLLNLRCSQASPYTLTIHNSLFVLTLFSRALYLYAKSLPDTIDIYT